MEEAPRAPLDMETIVAEALSRLVELRAEAQAEIELPRVWPVAVGYAPWIEEVWANYVSNALKYGRSAAENAPPCIVLGYDAPQNGVVRFWIRDHGRGSLFWFTLPAP